MTFRRLLVINSGSSSLKWSLLEVSSEKLVEHGALEVTPGGGVSVESIFEQAKGFDAIAHRLVHGGAHFDQAVEITGEVRAELENLVPLAPLHMKSALGLVDSCQAHYSGLPAFAAFDTSFHRSIPADRKTYALPKSWRQRYGLERFGFHGLSVDYCISEVATLAKGLPERVIVCHLGSGCSITAVKNGRSFDTTMGFTPLEGPMMGTRSGSIDPGLLIWLCQQGLPLEDLEQGLQHQSGLLGLSEVSSDLRVVERAMEAGSEAAELAYGAFIVSLRRAFGAMLGSLGGVDAIVFTGGIGENSARIRQAVVEPFSFLGLELVPEQDQVSSGAKVSTSQSKVNVFVIEAREDLAILRSVR